jgi:hypothetical protein
MYRQKNRQGKVTPTSEEGIELTRLEPVVLEVEQGGELLSHLILFEIKAKLNMTGEGLVVDGDIKETIYQMREF